MDTFVKKKIKLTNQSKKNSKLSPLSEKYKQYLKQPSSSNKKKKTPSPRRSDIHVVKKNNNPSPTIQSMGKKPLKKKESIAPSKQTNVKKPMTNKSKKVKDRVRRTKSRRKLSKKHTLEKKISIKCFPKNKKNLKNKMKGIDKMSKETMKQELRKNGIQIKGSQDSLVKDIYTVYSLGGIRITRE